MSNFTSQTINNVEQNRHTKQIRTSKRKNF